METRVLNDKRRLWKYIIFGVLTLGIYDIVFMWKMLKELNMACGYVERSDEDRSPNYIVMVLLSLITLGIYGYVWYYKQGNRMKRAGKSYGIEIDEKGSTYVLWILFGSLLFGIGPLVALYLFISNLNKLCSLYNYQIQIGRNHKTSSNNEYEKKLIENNSAIKNDNNAGKSYKVDDWMPQDYPTVGRNSAGSLKCIAGSYCGAEIELKPDEELIIGRNSNYSHLVISDPDISRKHCSVKFSMADGNYYVIDYSTFGVILNDSQKLESNVVTKCPSGSKLTLGNGNNIFILQ